MCFLKAFRATRPFLRRQRPGYLISAFSKTGSAQGDVGSAELDQANEQQHQGYAGHAQEVRPVDAEEDRVAVQVEDREIHEPGGHRNAPLEQFLHEGQDDIRREQADQRAIAQASGQRVNQPYSNQCHREHVEASREDPALVHGEMGELCPDQDREPGQERSHQDHQHIDAKSVRAGPCLAIVGC